MSLTKKLSKSVIIGMIGLVGLVKYDNKQINYIKPNNPPVAKAILFSSTSLSQDNSNFYIGDRVILDGSCSYDPDGNHANGSCSYASDNPDKNHLNYVWSISKLPTDSKLTNNNILNRSEYNSLFYPDATGDYTLELKVTDEKGASAVDYVTINVQNKIPTEIETKPVNHHKEPKKKIVKETPKEKPKFLKGVKGLFKK